jgi:valyl-tRNA synthetase
MGARYREWVQNLAWDWCISRQRYFGVAIPVWYCDACGEVSVASESQLPIDPIEQSPGVACRCGGASFTPEHDVMDTWATSSMTPQIVGAWLDDAELYSQVFPFALRPQAHEIIRTWAFYTILKSYHHFNALPWRDAAISGWGLAPQGSGKISKSRGGGPIAPMEMLDKYSADALRYWSASAGLGKDAVISEDKIQSGARLVTKLWNVARFSERFIDGYQPPARPPAFSPADRWILSKTQRLIQHATESFRDYDYAGAKSETENFFWHDLADNYLEMCKQRLYDETSATHEGARYVLHHVVSAIIKLFAPILPHVTEEIYQHLFKEVDGARSIHVSRWPVAQDVWLDERSERCGAALVEVATAVRRYKSEHGLSPGAELAHVHLSIGDPTLAAVLSEATADIMSITRAKHVRIGEDIATGAERLASDGKIRIALTR